MKLWQQFAERGQQRERDTRKFSSTNGVRAGAWLAAALWSAPFAHAQNTGTTLQPPQVSGTNVTLNWNSGGALQMAPSVMGPWQTATNGVSVSSSSRSAIAGGAKFFRVVDNGVPGPAIPIFPASPDDPLPVRQASIRRLPQANADGNAVLDIKFEAALSTSFRSFPLLLDDRLITVRDDGVFPDTQAGDGTFGVVVNVEPGELEAMNNRIAQLRADERIQPRFDGRQIVGSNRIDFFNISNFNAGLPVQAFPFAFGSAGAASATTGSSFGPPPPPGVFKSLMITDLSVVQDPARTWDPCNPGGGTPMGAWTFGRLMTDMANTPVTGIPASEFVRRWLRSWQFDQTINFDGVPNRDAAIRAQMLDAWQAASGGPGVPLNLAIAPFRLLAIVNRVDLRANTTYGGGSSNNPCDPPCLGGEARFVFWGLLNRY